MKKIYLFITAFVFFIILGVNLKLNMLSADQDVMEQKCTKCHSLRIPDNYTKAEWKYNVERMARRSGLTKEEIQIIIDLNTRK